MEKTKVDKFLDEFQDRYFLNSLEKKERQELRDFIISQNKDLLEACKEAIHFITIKTDDPSKSKLIKQIQNAINKAEN